MGKHDGKDVADGRRARAVRGKPQAQQRAHFWQRGAWVGGVGDDGRGVERESVCECSGRKEMEMEMEKNKMRKEREKKKRERKE